MEGGNLIDRPRTFVTYDIDILIPKDPSPSFPSDQALIAGIFLAVFWLLGRGYRWGALILSFIVITSRIYVGHHYPSDVFVGWLLGIFIVVGVYHILKRNKYTKKIMKNISI
jgi:undecaprenyl-diphosphatase